MNRVDRRLRSYVPKFSNGPPPRFQKFAFPCFMMSHITSKVSKPQVYQKLIQTCKYFYSKNPVVVIKSIHINSEYSYINDRSVETKAFKKFPFKFWLEENASILCNDSKNSNNFNILKSKIYRLNLIRLYLQQIKLKYSDLKWLASKTTRVVIDRLDIIHDSPVDTSDVIKLFVDAECFLFRSSATLPYTSKTIKNLLDVPAFPNLDELRFFDATEVLNLDDLEVLMQKHPKARTYLHFSQNIPVLYKVAIYYSKNRLHDARIDVKF